MVMAQQDHLGRDHLRESDRDAGIAASWLTPTRGGHYRQSSESAHREHGSSVRYWHSLTNVSKGGRDGETNPQVGNRLRW